MPIQQSTRSRRVAYKVVKNRFGLSKLLIKFCCKILLIILLSSILTACAQEGVESMVEEKNIFNESENEHICPVENGDFSSELIGGRWRLSEDSMEVFLTFCADGTGVELNNGIETIFEWSADDGHLTRERIREGEVVIREWEYSIERSISNDRDILWIVNLENGFSNIFYRWSSP